MAGADRPLHAGDTGLSEPQAATDGAALGPPPRTAPHRRSGRTLGSNRRRPATLRGGGPGRSPWGRRAGHTQARLAELIPAAACVRSYCLRDEEIEAQRDHGSSKSDSSIHDLGLKLQRPRRHQEV